MLLLLQGKPLSVLTFSCDLMKCCIYMYIWKFNDVAEAIVLLELKLNVTNETKSLLVIIDGTTGQKYINNVILSNKK